MTTTTKVTTAIAAMVFMTPSALINAVHQLGHTPGAMAYPLAVASVLSVVLAGTAPFALGVAVRDRRVGLFVTAMVAFVVCAGFNLVSAVGAASTSRSEIAGTRSADNNRSALLNGQLKSLESSRSALNSTQTIGMVDSSIAAMRTDARWTRSRECSDATLPDSRTFCADYARLQGQRDAAVRAERLDADIAAIKAQLLASSSTAAMGQPIDPQADTLAAAMGSLGLHMSAVSVGRGLNLTFALVIEVLGSLGPVVFASLFRGVVRPVRDVVHAGDVAVRTRPEDVVHPEGNQDIGVVRKLVHPVRELVRGPVHEVETEASGQPLARTAREPSVESLAMNGMSEREIAKRLGIGKTTVNRRLRAMRERLN